MKFNKKYLILLVALLITLVSVASAADVDDSISSFDVTATTINDSPAVDTQIISKDNNANEIQETNDVTHITKEETNGQTILKSQLNRERKEVENQEEAIINITGPEIARVNKDTNMVIIAKDNDGKLLDNEEIKIKINEDEPITTNLENGIYIYTLTPTTPGTLNFTVTLTQTETYKETENTKEITVEGPVIIDIEGGKEYTYKIKDGIRPKYLTFKVYSNGTLLLNSNNSNHYYLNQWNNIPCVKFDDFYVNITDFVINITEQNPSDNNRRWIVPYFENPCDYENINLIITSDKNKERDLVIQNLQEYKSTTYENIQFKVFTEVNDKIIPSNVNLKNCTIKTTGRTFNLAKLTIEENVTIENSNIEFDMDQEYVSGNQTYRFNGTLVKSNVILKNNTITAYSVERDSIIPEEKYGYAISLIGENITVTDNIFDIRFVRAMNITGNNNIVENITIMKIGNHTIKITGDNNIVCYNTLIAGENIGDDSVINSGQNNIIQENLPQEALITIISPETVNINKETPIVIIAKDYKGNLLDDEEIIITINEDEPVITNLENGIYIYILTPNTHGVLNFMITLTQTERCKETENTLEIIVDVDKDAIIEELNSTINELNTTIQDQTTTINSLNETINYQADIIEELNDVIRQQNEKINELTQQNTELNNTVNIQTEIINLLEEQISQLTAARNTTITLDSITDTKYNTKTTISGMLVNEDSIGLFNQTVTLTIGNKTVNVTTKNGLFEYTTTFKTIGEQTVTALYAGNDKYLSSEDTTKFTISKQDVIVTLNPITDIKYGENVTITGKFTDNTGKVITNTNVKITINDKKYYAKTDSTGVFSLNVKITTIGKNNVTYGYSGNTNYNSYEDTTSFNINKQDVTVTLNPMTDVKLGDNITLTGTFKDANGNSITNSNVKIIINGKKFYAKTDNNGIYSLTLTVTTVGINNITIGYTGNDKYNAYEENLTCSVGPQYVMVTYEPISDVEIGENVTITGTFMDVNGNAIRNSNVKITINGKKHYAKTDITGKYILSVATTKEGINNVTIGYSGSDRYITYETSTTFTVKT